MTDTPSPLPEPAVGAETSGTSDDDLIEDIAESYLAHLRAGKPPMAAAFIASCPRLRVRLERRLSLVEMLFRMGRAALETRGRSADGGDLHTAAKERPSIDWPETVPPVVGDYDIVSELGRGGMGVVYKAHHRRLNRLAALKMILASGSTRLEERVRFQVEAQSLASLQHTNIVQVFEVGDHQGRPFLALEFIEGGSLDQMIQAQQQHPIESALLVETLARGMHAAHQRGIVHRDLKPANVLMHGKGKRLVDFIPKITDFGLAKRLQEDSPSQTRGILGTPCYMAPEQADTLGRPITPATDVYGLGAILYEMLTGRPPFRAESSFSTIQQVLQQDPQPPSRFHPGLPRDLETICLKCLHKDPERRYHTAEALAEDLRRFRVGEPIHARPVPQWERAWLWARRRKALATLIAVTVMGTISFIAVGSWYSWQLREQRNQLRVQRDRADDNLESSLEAVHDMLTIVGAETLEHEPHMEAKRRELLDNALRFYRKFLHDQGDNPRLKRDVALATKSMGDVLRYLGQYHEAATTYRDALALLDEAEKNQAADDGHAHALANARADGWNGLGESLRLATRPREAIAAYQQSLTLWTARERMQPDDFSHREQQARVRYNLALAARTAGDSDRAEGELATAIAVLKPGGEASTRQHLARCHIIRGMILKDRKAYDEAERNEREAIALLRALHATSPQMPEYQHELAVAYNNLGNLRMARAREQPAQLQGILYRWHLEDQADAAHEEAINLLVPLTTNFPLRQVYRQDLANAHNSRGYVRSSAGDMDGAEMSWGESCAILKKLVADNPQVIDYKGDLGMTWGNMGIQRAMRQPTTREDWIKAHDFFSKAVTSLKATLEINENHPDYRRALRDHYRNLAEASIHTKQPQHARQAAEALALLYPRDPFDCYNAACFTARCLDLLNDKEAQEEYAQLAIRYLHNAAKNGFNKPDVWQADEVRYFQPFKNHAGYREARSQMQR